MYKVAVIFLMSLTMIITGCASCNRTVLSTSTNGAWNADIKHRDCGRYSGYAIALYRVGEKPPGMGKGGKEPFKTIYKTSETSVIKSPVTLDWSNNEIIVYHNTRKSINDVHTKPMIIKADKIYEDLKIRYIPEPVLWDTP